MDFDYNIDHIKLKKELNYLDELIISFKKYLKEENYSIISGYIAILFGRSRSSEDIDLLVKPMTKEDFLEFWKRINKEFECINTNDPQDAFENYLQKDIAIRFYKSNIIIPNIEFKFLSTALDHWILDNKLKVDINSESLFISPLELQIAYKLFLGSEKDIEDAKFLFEIFKDQLNEEVFNSFLDSLKQQDTYRRYLI